jgi:hypothetical protein
MAGKDAAEVFQAAECVFNMVSFAVCRLAEAELWGPVGPVWDD